MDKIMQKSRSLYTILLPYRIKHIIFSVLSDRYFTTSRGGVEASYLYHYRLHGVRNVGAHVAHIAIHTQPSYTTNYNSEDSLFCAQYGNPILRTGDPQITTHSPQAPRRIPRATAWVNSPTIHRPWSRLAQRLRIRFWRSIVARFALSVLRWSFSFCAKTTAPYAQSFASPRITAHKLGSLRPIGDRNALPQHSEQLFDRLPSFAADSLAFRISGWNWGALFAAPVR